MKSLVLCLATILIATAVTGDDDDGDPHAAAREAMVQKQIENCGVMDPAVRTAMRAVPRHRFVPAEYAGRAYDDHPCPLARTRPSASPISRP